MEEALLRIKALEDRCDAKDVAISTLQARNNNIDRALDASATRTQALMDRIEVGAYTGAVDRMLVDASSCIARLDDR